jgi:hypothetical protein
MKLTPEHQTMRDYLLKHGIDAIPFYIKNGSLRGCWRLHKKGVKWSDDLSAKLSSLGFVGFDWKPLHQFSGNGGIFQVFVRKTEYASNLNWS